MLPCRLLEFDVQAVRPVNKGNYATTHRASSFTNGAWTSPVSWPTHTVPNQWFRSHHEQPESRSWWTSADCTTTPSDFSLPGPRTAAVWRNERTTTAC